MNHKKSIFEARCFEKKHKRATNPQIDRLKNSKKNWTTEANSGKDLTPESLAFACVITLDKMSRSRPNPRHFFLLVIRISALDWNDS